MLIVLVPKVLMKIDNQPMTKIKKFPLSIGYYEELNDSDIKYFIEIQYL
jgi:hypothetical protein